MNPLVTAATLIIHVIFSAYIVILLLRFILQKLGASWHNPLSQFIIKLTEKPLLPFRKIVPGMKGYDFSIIVLALIIQWIELILLFLLDYHMLPNLLGIVILAIGHIASKFVYIYIYAIIINAIASWIPTIKNNPAIHIVFLIVNPIISRFRRFVPAFAGIDISPLFALLALMLANILIVGPLITLGTRLAVW